MKESKTASQEGPEFLAGWSRGLLGFALLFGSFCLSGRDESSIQGASCLIISCEFPGLTGSS